MIFSPQKVRVNGGLTAATATATSATTTSPEACATAASPAAATAETGSATTSPTGTATAEACATASPTARIRPTGTAALARLTRRRTIAHAGEASTSRTVVHSGGTILRAASVAALTPRCTGATFAILHAVAHFTAILAPGLGSTGINPPRIASSTQVFP